MKKEVFAEYIGILKSAVLSSLIVVFIFNLVFPGPLGGAVVNYMTAAAVLISLPFTGRGAGAVCMVLFMLGGLIIYSSGGSPGDMAAALGKNTSLLALMMTVPMLGIALRHGGYIGVLDAMALKYMRGRHRMYLVPALLSHALGVFMNIGAVPLTYEVAHRGAMIDNPEILSRSLSRGFSAALMWSPNMIAVALVLAYLNVPWQEYAPVGFLFACAALFTGYVVYLAGRVEPVEKKESGGGGEVPQINRVMIVQLCLAAFVFLSTILVVEVKTSLSVISVIPVMAIVFPAAWLVLAGGKSTIANGYLDYFRYRINRYDGEVVLFAAAGFFSGALALSGWSAKLGEYIMLFSSGSRASAAMAILGAVVLTSVAGIHPMVVVSALAASLDPAALGFSPVQTALVLITGWSVGATVSPMSGTCLVVGGLMGKSPIEVGYSNILHASVVLAAVIAYTALG